MTKTLGEILLVARLNGILELQNALLKESMTKPLSYEEIRKIATKLYKKYVSKISK